ncbi:MAG: tetratricopeptide repeat protein [Armatimonadetes bacterium]|nr:tetratricopeptide repeat protein [Armatimonadota bacterium]
MNPYRRFSSMLHALCTMLLALCSVLHAQPQLPWPKSLDPYLPLVKQIGLPPEVMKALQPVGVKSLKVENSVPKPVKVDLSSLLPPGAQVAATQAGGDKGALPGPETVRSPQVKVESPMPQGADQRQVLYLERIKKGDQSPELFAYLKQIPFKELVTLIEKTPNFELQPEERQLRMALVKTLIETHNVSPESAGSLPEAVVLAVAEYYAGLKDERCVKLYEGLLAKRKIGPHTWLPELYGLGRYWSRTGNYAKAAGTFLRAANYSTDKPLLANCTLEAARQYLRMGDEKRAFEQYESVARFGYGWGTGMSIVDQAGYLMGRGKHEEARKLLVRPVTGQYADQIKVIMLERLGYSYHQTKEYEPAEKCLREAIKLYESIPNPLQGHGVEYVVESARRLLSEIEAK